MTVDSPFGPYERTLRNKDDQREDANKTECRKFAFSYLFVRTACPIQFAFY